MNTQTKPTTRRHGSVLGWRDCTVTQAILLWVAWIVTGPTAVGCLFAGIYSGDWRVYAWCGAAILATTIICLTITVLGFRHDESHAEHVAVQDTKGSTQA